MLTRRERLLGSRAGISRPPVSLGRPPVQPSTALPQPPRVGWLDTTSPPAGVGRSHDTRYAGIFHGIEDGHAADVA